MLQKQLIALKMSGGMDTKTDPRWVVPGKWSLLQDCYMQRDGEIKKRYGFTPLLTDVQPGGASTFVTSAQRLATYKDELLVFSNEYLYSYSPQQAKWTEMVRYRTAVPEIRGIHSSTYDATVPDVCYNQNVAVAAWEENGTTWYRVIDWMSGETIIPPTSFTGTQPQLVAKNDVIALFFVDGTSLKFRSFDRLNPATTPVVYTPVSGNVNATARYDVMARSDTTNAILVAYTHTDGNAHAQQVNASTGANMIADTSMAHGANMCLGWHFQDSYAGSFVYLGLANTTNGVLRKELNKSTLAVNATTTVDSGATSNVNNIVGVGVATSIVVSGQSTWYSITNATTYNSQIKENGSPTIAIRSATFASKIFKGPDGYGYVLLAYDSVTQGCYVLVRLSPRYLGEPLGRPLMMGVAMYGSGGVTPTRPSCLPAVTSITATKFIMGALRKQRIDSTDGKFANATTFQRGLSAVIWDFDSTVFGRAKDMGDMLFFPGGIGSSYEAVWNGAALALPERVPILYPEQPTLAGAAGGSLTASATYRYIIVYARTDRRTGRVIRSAGSVSKEVTLTAAQSRVDLTIPTLRMTSLDDYVVEIYRTEANGTNYYRITSATSPTRNSLTADTISYGDTASDATALTGEQLYTTGGTLDAFHGPPCRVMEAHRNRLWAISSEDGTLWPSLELEAGMGLQFNHNLRISPENSDGLPTALASMDDKLVIFKKSSIYIITGDGPNARGDLSGGAFQGPERVTSIAGTTIPRSVVSTPFGVFFKDSKGFYLLTRSLEVVYVGAEIESYNDRMPTGAVLMESLNQVRWATSTVTLVYDFHFKQWAVFNQPNMVDCAMWQGNCVMLQSDGVVQQELVGSYLDNGNDYSMVCETSHLSFANVRGFQRIYEIQIAGDFSNNATLTVFARYDHGTTNNGTYAINVDNVDVDSKYEVRIKPQTRRCSSIQLRMVNSASGAAGVTIAALAFLAGVAPGKGGRLGSSSTLL